MKTPVFWKSKNLISSILLPLSGVYYLLGKLNFFLRVTKKVSIPVICIGNIIVGGSGKTPIAIAIAKLLQERGKKVAFISRGYKGKLSSNKPIKIDTQIHSYKDVGDEPLLLSKTASTYICKNRFLSAKMAKDDGAEVIIMDDGFQNYSLNKDLSILVFNENSLLNKRIIPAGPLRESIKDGFKKADIIVCTEQEVHLKTDKPKFKAEFVFANEKEISGKTYVAFCGIANPERFFNSLEKIGCTVLEKYTFPDHHSFTDEELENIFLDAKKQNCEVITTEKDFVRLPSKFQDSVVTLNLCVKISPDILNLSFG